MYTINPFSEHIVSRKRNLENPRYVSFINLIIGLKTLFTISTSRTSCSKKVKYNESFSHKMLTISNTL